MRPRRPLALVAALAALTVTAVAAAATLAKVTYQDVLPKAGTGQVTFKTQRAASFSIVLRVPTQGRARLYLLGAKAPKGGPLIDTRPSTVRRRTVSGCGRLVHLPRCVRAAAEGHLHVAHRVERAGQGTGRAHRPLVTAGLALRVERALRPPTFARGGQVLRPRSGRPPCSKLRDALRPRSGRL